MDQRSPARHPDFLGPDDLIIKIEELREATDGQVPIFVKMGATRTFDDVKLAAKAGADAVTIDESGGAFAPGATSQADGDASIDITVALDGGTDSLTVLGTPGDDIITLGSGEPGCGSTRRSR